MINQIDFKSSAFQPTPAELDQSHKDYINPGVYALALADFLVEELALRGYPVKFRCQEDWGHWIELEHSGNFTLALGCANIEDDEDLFDEHRIIIMKPSKPVVRKLFRKIDVQEPVAALVKSICGILENDARVSEINTDTV